MDPATNCWLEHHEFVVDDPVALGQILGDVVEPNYEFDIERPELEAVAAFFGIRLGEGAECGLIVVFDGPTNFDPNWHTGRELLLMLEGRKPLAYFYGEPGLSIGPGGSIPEKIIPELAFQPYVEAGRFTRWEGMDIMKVGRREISVKRVLFAQKGEAWRIGAYQMLWHLLGKYGWGPELERAEGFLLGYEPEIDPYFCDRRT